jgi:5-hydroxyisourate hydrolase
MSTLSTHVLDAASGQPAAGMRVGLDRRDGDRWQPLGEGVTDDDGRVRDLAAGGLGAGVHRLFFATGDWFAATGQTGFYPEVSVVFEVTDPNRHYHVPLLLSPYAFSTYRGS